MEENSESQETKAASVMGEREEPRLPWQDRLPGNNGETSRQFAPRDEQNKAEPISMKGRFGPDSTHKRGELKVLPEARGCQLVPYSRRSVAIHYAADVSRVRVQRDLVQLS